MNYDFDHTLNHRVNASYRWGMEHFPEDIIGMGTADLDYTCPPCVREALVPIAEENTYNYRQHTQEYYDTVIGWYQRKYGLTIQKEWLSNVPSTIGAIRVAMGIFAKAGDHILVQSPLFEPLTWAIEGCGCKVLRNSMKLTDRGYELDLEDFEDKIRRFHPPIFLLVNPHNPTGRVFTKDELSRMVDICSRYGVKIISDEVHSLVLYDGNVHTPILAVSEEAKQISIQVVSLSKGYNLMSLPHAIVTIADEEMRAAWNRQILAHSFGYAVNSFAIAAVTSILKGDADEWMEEMTAYLKTNFEEAMAFFREKQLPLHPIRPQGGYLLWIDCRDCGWNPETLSDAFMERCHIDLNNGAAFGPEGVGFIRMNFAVTHENLKKALERIAHAFSVQL